MALGALLFPAAGAGAQAPGNGYPVALDNRTLFEIKAPRAPYTAAQRAKNMADDLRAAAEDRHVHPDELRIVQGETDSILLAGHTFILMVTDADAGLENRSREELIREWERIVASAIVEYRRARAPWIMARNVLLAILCWALVAASLRVARRVNRRTTAWLQRFCQRILEKRHLGGIHSLYEAQLQGGVKALVNLATVLIGAIVISMAISYSLGLFPGTADVSFRLFNYIRNGAALIAKSIVGYLPNLAVILLVVATTYGFIRLIGAALKAMERGAIALPGFHREWIEPTNKIVTFLAVLFALVVIFPYLPGGDSPAFRGASIFLGVLVSLGSSSAMGNVIAGIILTYMRPFRVGDRVRIADTVGDVVEKSLLVTRMRTVKNVHTIIPNSMILGAHILNYSAEAEGRGLIVHTSITIGYNVPWRTVHQLMVDAALATRGILDEPRPYVLQTSLNDFHISYEVNGFTDRPNEMHLIGPELHARIQDEFNGAGVEIMSPSYLSMRDGNTVTIPEEQRPKDYRAPSFRVHLASKGENAGAESAAGGSIRTGS